MTMMTKLMKMARRVKMMRMLMMKMMKMLLKMMMMMEKMLKMMMRMMMMKLTVIIVPSFLFLRGVLRILNAWRLFCTAPYYTISKYCSILKILWKYSTNI